MPTPEESRTLALAVAADLSDLVPPLPFVDFVSQVVDAATTQRIRSTFPMEKGSTVPSLLENIELPGVAFIPGVGPLLAKAPDLVPGHTLGVLTALKERYGSLGAAGISPPKVRLPPPPPPPKVRVPDPRELGLAREAARVATESLRVIARAPSLRVPPPPRVRVSLPGLRVRVP